MFNIELKNKISRALNNAALSHATQEQFLQNLYAIINNLIQTDLARLISILRRIDVSERKLKQLLSENNETDAAKIIAALMIEREQEKILSRKNFGNESSGISEEERW